ncbi:MAG: hypothetical protein KKA19_00860, partial [Candidatus Margulisbacteria bacterium]|nr:hypothetical protein [Candidatus Margulisiibacteriota bacterium]
LPYAALVINYFDQDYLRSKSKKIPLNTTKMKKIELSIYPGKDFYEPGETAQFFIETKNLEGKNVPAYFSLAIVDEALIQLSGAPNTDIFSFFYNNRYNLVSTDFSRWALGGYDYYGGGAKELQEIALRKNFKDTAYWQPWLKTDSSGKTSISFKLPDNLTTWRATAVAYNHEAQMGDGTGFTKVKKKLMVESNLPRFFREGDNSEISAMIFNQSGLSEKADINTSITAEGLAEKTEKFFNIRIGDGQRSKLSVPFQVPYLKDNVDLKVTIRAKAPLIGEDGEESIIPLIPRKFTYTVWSLPFVNYQQQKESIYNYDLGALDLEKMEDLAFEIDFFSDPTFLLVPALKYLIHYPYGCTEQTMSAFLPNLYVQKVLKIKNISAPEITNNLPEFNKVALKKLLDYQHADGGWGVWENDDSDLWHTAYVLYGLNTAKENGLPVDNNVIQKGINNLRYQIMNYYYSKNNYFYGSADTLSVLPFSVWVLGSLTNYNQDIMKYALRKLENDYLKKVGNQIKESNTALSYLIRIYVALGQKNIAQKYSKLLLSKQNNDGSFRIRSGDIFMWYSSDVEETAEAIIALQNTDHFKEVQKAVNFLVENSKNGYWHNTRASAKAIYALAKIAEDKRFYKKDQHHIKVMLQDAALGDWKYRHGEHHKIALTNEQIKNGHQIKVLTDGSTIYAAMNIKGIYRGLLDKRYLLPENKLEIKRVLYKKDTAGEQGAWSQVHKPQFKMGDNVKISIEINIPKNLRDVVIEVPLPAGLSYVGLNESKNRWWYREEKRSDRIIYFFKDFYSGTTKLEAMVQAQTPGEFSMPPATIQCMYRPELTGSTLEEIVEIK